MSQLIEELQNKPYGDIIQALIELGPQVMTAKQQYEDLAAQQRALLAARELISAGVRIGDTVQLQGVWNRRKNPMGIVAVPLGSILQFQVLGKDGKPSELVTELMFTGFEKI